MTREEEFHYEHEEAVKQSFLWKPNSVLGRPLVQLGSD